MGLIRRKHIWEGEINVSKGAIRCYILDCGEHVINHDDFSELHTQELLSDVDIVEILSFMNEVGDVRKKYAKR